MIDFETLGKRIQENRKMAGLSQEKLAELIQVSTTSIARIEHGNRKPSLSTLVKISSILNIRVDDLLTGNIAERNTDYDKDFRLLLADCNNYEKRMILDIAKSVKESLKSNESLLKTVYASMLDNEFRKQYK